MEISNSYTKNVYERLLELKISGISSKLKATYVFVFVRSTILDVSILKPKVSYCPGKQFFSNAGTDPLLPGHYQYFWGVNVLRHNRV